MHKFRTFMIVLWLLIISLILGWTVTDYGNEIDAALKKEIILRHSIFMVILSLPSGFFLLLSIATLAGWLSVPLGGISEAILISVACGSAGYFQWFVVLPVLLRKFGSWREQK